MGETYEIVILGAHHAGVSTAHYILRHVLPTLAKTTKTTYHVTIVAPHTEFFYNIAGPRVAVNADLVPFDKVFLPIADGFKEYKPDNYTFIIGKATAVDPERKVITVQLSNTKTQKVLNYSSLVLATGSKADSPLWYVNENSDITRNAYQELRASLESATTVLIAGGGAVGVETAGEIGYYLKKEVTLLSGGPRLLPRHPPGNSATAQSKLKDLGVETIHNLKVISSYKIAGGKTEVKLSDGTSRKVDVYIDATGAKPNSSFLPPAWLNSSGHVNCDKSFRVIGAPNVYAAGDLASCSDGGVQTVMFGTPAVGSSIAVDIAKEMGVESPVPQKELSLMKDTQFVTIGPQGGVAQVKAWRLPSIAVWALKARTLFVEKAEGSVKGADYIKP